MPSIDPAHDLAAILYSGGTTGLPKGVLLSRRKLVATPALAEQALDLDTDDVVIAALSFFHIYGLHVIPKLALQAGATVVSMPRFELGQFLDLIERHRVSRAYIVPAVAVALAEADLTGRDLTSLRHVLSASAPLGTTLTGAMERQLGCPVSEGLATTVMSGVTHVVPPFGAVAGLARSATDPRCRVPPGRSRDRRGGAQPENVASSGCAARR